MEESTGIRWSAEINSSFVKAVKTDDLADIGQFLNKFIPYIEKNELKDNLNAYLLKIILYINNQSLLSKKQQPSLYVPVKLIEQLSLQWGLKNVNIKKHLFTKGKLKEDPFQSIIIQCEPDFTNVIIQRLKLSIDDVQKISIMPSTNRETQNQLNKKMLELLANNEDYDVLAFLLIKFGAQLNPPLEKSLPRSPLHTTILQNNIKIFQLLLNHETENNFVNYRTLSNDRTCGHYAVIHRRINMLKEMLFKLADDKSKIEKFFLDKDCYGFTVLHYIAMDSAQQVEFSTTVRSSFFNLGNSIKNISEAPVKIQPGEEYTISPKPFLSFLFGTLLFTPYTLAYIFGNGQVVALLEKSINVDTKPIIELLKTDPSIASLIKNSNLFLKINDPKRKSPNVKDTNTLKWQESLPFQGTLFDLATDEDWLSENQKKIRTSLIRFRRKILAALSLEHLFVDERQFRPITIYINPPNEQKPPQLEPPKNLEELETPDPVIKPKLESDEKTNSSSSLREESVLNIPHIDGLKFVDIPKDGHCLFHAVAIYLQKEQHTLREETADYLKEHLAELGDFIVLPKGKNLEDYVNDLRHGVAWASNVEIDILMSIFKRPILIIESNGKITNFANVQRFNNEEPIFVFYDSHKQHYSGLVLAEGANGQIIAKTLLESTQVSLQQSPESEGLTSPSSSPSNVEPTIPADQSEKPAEAKNSLEEKQHNQQKEESANKTTTVEIQAGALPPPPINLTDDMIALLSQALPNQSPKTLTTVLNKEIMNQELLEVVESLENIPPPPPLPVLDNNYSKNDTNTTNIAAQIQRGIQLKRQSKIQQKKPEEAEQSTTNHNFIKKALEKKFAFTRIKEALDEEASTNNSEKSATISKNEDAEWFDDKDRAYDQRTGAPQANQPTQTNDNRNEHEDQPDQSSNFSC